VSQPQRPQRSKNRVTPIEPGHWYTTSAPTDSASASANGKRERALPDAVTSKRGRTRERMARRQTGDQPNVPQFAPLELRWIHIVLGAAAVGIIAVLTLSVFAATRAARPSDATAVPTNAPVLPVLPLANVMPPITVSAWNGKARYTVLVLGVDQRPGDSLSDSRTDVMIVLSVDPVTHSAGMLSIPRDLFVPIPGESDLQRINTAFEIGELKAPNGGPLLAMQTVQYNLGLHVDHYVIFNFQAVIALVDAVGGVDIDVPSVIDDPEYPDMNNGYDPLHIPAGHIHMVGGLALKYARTRHGDNDYERTHRQQQVILALRDKVTRLNMLPQLLQQAPQLWSQFQNNVETNLTLDQTLGLIVYAKDIPFDNIKRGTIEGQYARAMAWNGDTVVTPNRQNIGELMTQIFGANYDK